MVVLVVQPEDHRRVLGQLHQQGIEAPEPVEAEHFHLVEDSLGLVELGVTGGEDAVPEEGQLLLQGPMSLDHAVYPIRLGVWEERQVVLARMVPPDKVIVLQAGRRVLGMHQLLYCGLVAPGQIALKLLARRPEPGASQQMGHQR